MKPIRILAALALAAIAVGAGAATPSYSFNALMFNDYRSFNSDSEGSLAAGGSFYLSGYSVNSHLSSTLGLFAGQNLNLTNGQVNGDVQTVGSVSLSGAGITGTATRVADSFVPRAKTYFTDLSRQYDARAITGGAVRESWGGVTFTGSGSGPQVFDVSFAMLSGANSWNFNGVTAGQQVVLNISGTSASFTNFDMDSLSRYRTVLNFTEALAVDFTNVSPWASVLAPYADITGKNGHITGSVVASGWNSTLELHVDNSAAFAINSGMFAAPVPEPKNLHLMLLGFLVFPMAVYMKKRRNIDNPFVVGRGRFVDSR